MKRKNHIISKEPIEHNKKEETFFLSKRSEKDFTPTYLTSTTSDRLMINLPAYNCEMNNYVKIPWLQWKKNSCRIDVFATILYHILYFSREKIFPKLNESSLPNEIHPIGILTQEIHNASSITVIQRAVDKYIAYRSRYLKEKQGDGGVIYTLFSSFTSISEFIWSFEAETQCDLCGNNSLRYFDVSQPFTISLASLLNCQ